MHFLLVLVILAALVIAESSPSEPVAGAGYRLAIALACMGVVALLPMLFSGWIAQRLRRDFQRRGALLSLFGRLRRAHAALWLAVAVGISYWLDWARLVRFNWGLDRVILVDEVLILLPVLLPMVVTWAAFYEVDRAVRLGLSDCGVPAPPLATRRQYLMLHLRHYLGIVLLPVLALLAFRDAAERLVPGVLQTAWGPAVFAVPAAAVFVGFPWMLRCVWKTRPLAAGPLRARLESAAARAGLRFGEIFVWQTEGRLVNAAVAGVLPKLRCVFLSDGLLRQLDEEEIEAVFGHEIGHVRHCHLVFRVLAVLAPLSVGVLVERALPGTLEQAQRWLAGGGLGLKVPTGLLLLAALGVYAWVVFGGYARLLEAQADLFGCGTLASGGVACPVETFCGALEKLAAASGTDRRASTWQHGSIARRVEFLGRVAADAAYLHRFHRRVRLLGALIIGVALSPLVCWLL